MVTLRETRKSMSDQPESVIRLQMTVARIKTMADGGYRAEFDLPETALDAVTKLMEAKSKGAILETAIVAVITLPVATEAKPNDRPNKRFSPYAKDTQAKL